MPIQCSQPGTPASERAPRYRRSRTRSPPPTARYRRRDGTSVRSAAPPTAQERSVLAVHRIGLRYRHRFYLLARAFRHFIRAVALEVGRAPGRIGTDHDQIGAGALVAVADARGDDHGVARFDRDHRSTAAA